MLLPSIATPTSMQSAVQRQPSILRSNHRHLAIVAHAQKSFELRVCTNRTCKRQGSPTVLKLAKDLALEQLTVNECGCLGSCGAGPNVALLPPGVVLHHVSTPADLAEVLSSQCGLSVSQELLKATELRLAGNAEAMSGNLQQAEQLYTQALELGVSTGRHLLLSNRSAVRLQQGKQQGALQDAQQAVEAAPADFTKAWVRLIDAHYALGEYRQAADMMAEATARCAGFKQAPEYKAIEAAVTKAAGKSSKVAA